MGRIIYIPKKGSNYIGADNGYGLLYNWYVTQGLIAPSGWHVPTKTEWETLITYLGGDTVAGGKLKEIGTTRWDPPNTDATNISGFNAVGGGGRFNLEWDGKFDYFLTFAIYWSSTPDDDNNSFGESLYSTGGYSYIYADYNTYGYSIRFIKDDSIDTGTVTDYDGNVYACVKIGNQVWTAANWQCTHYTDGSEIPEVTDNSAWAALTTGGFVCL